MQTISAIEYKGGNKVLTYEECKFRTDDIKKIVNRILGEEEIDRIKQLPLKDLKLLVEDILNNKGIDLLK